MESRLTGKWRATEKEELDQSKFIKIFLEEDVREEEHKFIHPEARISQKYLKYHSSFLSDN
jgi:hypothetical protein